MTSTERIRALAGAALAACVMLGPVRIAGQNVSGRVDEGAPSAGRALVSLENERGRSLAITVSGTDGAFSLDAPGAGTYRVVVERVGQTTVRSEAFALARGETATPVIHLTDAPVDLTTLDREAARTCTTRPGDSPLAAAWNEARKALWLVTWTQDQEAMLYDAIVHERDLEADGRTVRREPAPRVEASASRIFRRVPAQELNQRGFVRQDDAGQEYAFLPLDASVLVSDAFVAGHCWRLRQDGGPALVGVAFQPAEPSGVPDVEGVLWLDAATSHLVLMEFSYARTGLDVDLTGVGGHAVFQELPDGSWVTPEAWLRLPLLEVGADGAWRIAGYREEGASIRRVYSEDDEWSVDTDEATLTGTVTSRSGRPLQGAHVYLQGTDHETVTSSDGRYTIRGLLDGIYRVGFSHDEMDEVLAVRPILRPATLVRGRTTELDLRVPGPEEATREMCAVSGADDGVILTGEVRDSITGVPLTGLPLSIRFRDPRRPDRPFHEATVTTGSGGGYIYCDAPDGELVRIRALTPGYRESLDTTFYARGPEINRHDLVVPFSTEQGPGGLFGLIRDHATGQPIEAAEVSITGTDLRTLTSASGFYAFGDVPTGVYTVNVSHLAYRDREIAVQVSGSEAYKIDVQLTAEAIPIEGIVVTAVPRRLFGDMVDLHHRMDLGLGHFLVREDLEIRSGRLSNALQGQAGVRVLQGGEGSTFREQYVILRSALDVVSTATGELEVEYCYPAVWVDGQRFSKPKQDGIGHDPVDIAQFNTSDLEAVEIYKGAGSVPGEFGGGDAACGALVLWTRRGGVRIRGEDSATQRDPA